MEIWRQIQKDNFHSLEALSIYLELDETKRKKLLSFSSFPLNLPKRLAAKIKKNSLTDPLFLQFVPIQKEMEEQDGFSVNPVGDLQAIVTSKCLHKYPTRVLMLPTSACAMHCRFCFRKDFPYERKKKEFSEELALIQADTNIQEVILSGGDPLSLSNHVLGDLLQNLDSIPHLKRLRFHTRFPIGIPERIDSTFLSLLGKLRAQIWFLIHINHPIELDDDVLASLKKIQKLGIPVLSQTVLLKEVNDDEKTLQRLFEKLVDGGITPYYLHQLDKVRGSAHFEVTEEKGKKLLEALTKKLSGYAIPRYVKEIQGELSKTLIG